MLAPDGKPAPPTAPIRIAILECDTPVPKADKEYGGYGGIFKVLLEKGAANLGWPASALSLSNFDVVTKQEYPNLEDVDGILLTGSKHTAFENDPWILKLVGFVANVLAEGRVRIIGVCFGHQILGRACGAPVIRNSAWEVSVCSVDLTPKGKELFGRETLAIHQMHVDIVQELPDGVQSLGSSPWCKVQGMYAPKRLIAVQGHPEFNGKITQEIIETRRKVGVFTDEIYHDAEERANNDHDGVAIAATFLRFMQE